MKLRASGAVLTAAAAVLASSQAPSTDEAPPAIAQWGITNAASHLSPGLSGGSLARGSRVRIRGWRLGPAPSLVVRASTGAKTWSLAPITSGENEIEAILPNDAPIGAAKLQVIKNGQASLEWPIKVVEASFGAFSRNREGWGPGEIINADGRPNAEDQPARPGETVRLLGTGLGAEPVRPPQVLVAGQPAPVKKAAREGSQPGIDQIVFAIPTDTPLGCYVPVEVISAPGVFSNAVTLSISNSGPCGGASDALALEQRKGGALATAFIAHSDVILNITGKADNDYASDMAYASFVALERGQTDNPAFLSPPPGVCTPFNGATRTLLSPSSSNVLPGKPLDAGPSVNMQGEPGSRIIREEDPPVGHFFAIVGGHPLSPTGPQLPPFLHPGAAVTIKSPGGAAIPAFATSIRAAEPVVWTNRDALAEISRAQGAAIEWRASPSASLVSILLQNPDSRSGEMGAAICVERASAGRFRIPPYALANIPPSPARPGGLPLNLVFVVAVPELTSVPVNIRGLDRLLAFSASISGRGVTFR